MPTLVVNCCMSADPKSLATLAISITSDNGDNTELLQKFRSTDEFVAGWAAAFINTSALFPINKLIFRQMAGGHGASIAAGQMKEEGQ